ncbi:MULTISPECIES: MCE family protein [Dietzia]|uniref:MCE family protein n=1 Tax=Dietzia cinnamea TaxID=321318 RepID=A0A4R3ZLS8_9ACTN|nr:MULTISPECIES: MCE family protein [Dietzia]PWD96457.1 MCE family protein [Dietzia maris]MBM7229723.1 MCE family protein [Dietzia cinnamea]MCT1638754.1 MCE family protein [Dietzia cinnamea]MCT1885799.1 MCE family protein [Dietzia cinnamea]MCT2057617.1 MCE family protein [Dietzia cinnamea]
MSAARAAARELKATTVKLGIFATVMILVLVGLIVVFSEYRSGDFERYNAHFADVSGLESGDKVRIAGIEVGQVRGIDLEEANTANVSFTVAGNQVVHQSTEAVVRYENLTGDRYLELKRGEGLQTPLEPGGTIPLDQTAPALDLDALLGGFRPLFKALDPAQVNQLSESIVKVFQGEAGTVQDLLAATSSLTQTLADRDQLIGDVITNLTSVLTTVSENQENVDSIVDDLQQLVSGLATNSEPLAESVSRLNDSSANMTTLLSDVRPSLKQDIAQVDRVATLINDDEEFVEGVINRLPSDFEKMSRLGVYGSFFQFYLCGVIVEFTNPVTGKSSFMPQYEQKTGRCAFPDE